MPGHKLGSGIPDIFLSQIEKLDITEIPGLDDLHNPTGMIKEAQELAAEAFGAKKSYFLVNGSTVGLHTAITAVCRPGRRLITGRDSHSSVINGMLLAGVRPYYIVPEYSDAFAICTGITPGEVERALHDAPDAEAVLITRPNYYGICCDIAEIARIVHSYNKLLIVDEAHGAHLVFNKRLPVCALEAGADICVQSAHKTLPAFTQGAYLHIGSDRVDIERLEYFLDMFQSTSPSYVIMAFLDIARAIMHRQGTQLLDKLLDSLETYSSGFGGGELLLLDTAGMHGFDLDATRLTVNVAGLGLTGYDAEGLLRQKYNIQAEMSDPANVVFICTVADSPERIEKLFSSLDQLRHYLKPLTEKKQQKHLCFLESRYTELYRDMGINDREPALMDILNAETDRTSLQEAAGRISKGIIAPYPPGVPLVCPGETITRKTVEFLSDVIKAGGRVHGVNSDGTVAVIAKR